ncbi:MAG TPA: hypothetical protein DF383_13715 [Deltaproteobacteria bacterium]|nr:hypothetical protein [Deltaproteobacteria bacterium]
MKIVRFQHGEEIGFGLLKNNEEVQVLSGAPQESFHVEKILPRREVELLAPILPSKIIGIGLNYRHHAEELHIKVPEEPLIFLKPLSALNGPEDPIRLPAMSQKVEAEPELAVVIGKRCRHVKETEAAGVILGYSCFNDVTARDLQKKDLQFTRAKSFDTFACLGPWIETQLDPRDLLIESRLNGELRLSARSSRMIFPVPKLISFISDIMTLEAGDIISTGTPAGLGPLQAGDKVAISIEGIGVLSNPVF